MDISKFIKVGVKKRQPRIFLYGEEKIGKSSFAASAPNVLFVCGEDGLVGDQFANTKHITPLCWADVIDLAKTLLTEGSEFKSLAFDSLDWLEPMLYAHTCKLHGQKTIESFGFGKGIIAAVEELRILLSILEKLDMTIIFIAHSHVKTFANPTGDNYDRYEPKANKLLAGLVKEWSDAILLARAKVYTNKDSAKAKAKGVGDIIRVINTNKQPSWDAGNRYSMPDELPLSWEAVAEAIKAGKVDEAAVIEAEISGLIERSPLATERKAEALAALARDKGKPEALKLLLNRVRQAA